MSGSFGIVQLPMVAHRAIAMIYKRWLHDRGRTVDQGRFYWVLVRSSTKDPEWQPARFTGVAGHSTCAQWDFIGFNGDVGHYFVEIVEIGPELTDGPGCERPRPRH